MIKLATWNVNSIRIRMESLQKLVFEERPDIVCLQEVKAKEADFPFEEIKKTGFSEIALYSMPGYNGVAILSRLPLQKIKQYGHVGRNDARHISAVVNDCFELHNIYVPAGGNIPDEENNPSFKYKLQFVDELADFFGRQFGGRRIICGDFNIAPCENDVWSHKEMLKIISHTPVEIEKLNNFYKRGGFEDMIRYKYPEPQKVYSWWSYRNPNWQKNNKGRRLDHIWCDSNTISWLKDAKICKHFRLAERPSDHVPVIVELKI